MQDNLEEIANKIGVFFGIVPFKIYEAQDLPEDGLILDEDNKLTCILSADKICNLIDECKRLKKEKLELLLSKNIMRNFPVDFGDVWSIASRQIDWDNSDDIDTEEIVMNLKKSHPNLFVNLQDIIRQNI